MTGVQTCALPISILEAVGETGGGIDHDAGAVDRAQEGAGVGVGFGYDAVGVVAAVGVNYSSYQLTQSTWKKVIEHIV